MKKEENYRRIVFTILASLVPAVILGCNTENAVSTDPEVVLRSVQAGDVKINVNVDTGMNRVGIDFRRALEEIIAITSLPEIELEGVFTHFSCASLRDISYTNLQWDRFNKIITKLKESSIGVKTFHLY